MTDREKTSAAPAALLALLALCAPASPAAAANPSAGTSALLAASVGAEPATVAGLVGGHALRLMDGTRTSLAAMRGQVVVVNFWATWCRPCQHELPELARLATDLASRGGKVIAVSIDDDPRNVARFLKARAVRLPVACDGPQGLARDLDLKQVPLTLVLDRAGAVAWVSSRSDEEGLSETRAAVERTLAKPAAPPALAGDHAEDTP